MVFGKTIQPEKNQHIPSNAQRLGGVGDGARFVLYPHDIQNQYRIQRWNSDGSLECDEIFIEQDSYTTSLVHPTISDKPQGGAQYIPFDASQEYQITYPSHCKECIILQDNRLYKFVSRKYAEK